MASKSGELLRSNAAARTVGVSKRSLQEWVQHGLLVPTAWTPGGHARWDAADLRRQLDEFHRAWT